jgi:microcystin-dependent protein
MATQPTIFDDEPATSAEVNSIPQTGGADVLDLTKLWPDAFEVPLSAGGLPVLRKDMNALLAMLLQNIYFMQIGGVYLYQADKIYTVGTRVLHGTEFYKCIQVNGPTTSAGVVAPDSATGAECWDRLVCASQIETTPAGIIVPYGGDIVPSGYLDCNGAAVSRTGKARLFAAIGTKWGAGDGVTTFNLPNLNDGSYLKGSSSAGTKGGAVLPSLYATSAGAHTHTRGTMEISGSIYNSGVGVSAIGSGAFQIGGDTPSTYSDPSSQYPYKSVGFTASRSWTGETSWNGAHTHTVTNSNGVATGTTVEPKNATVRYIIKE